MTRPVPTVQGLTIDDIRSVVGGAIDQKLADLHRSVGDTATRSAAQAFVAARLAGVQGMLHAVAALLAVRLALMMVLIGAFVLSIAVLREGTYQADALMVAYAMFVVLPIVWLSSRRPDHAP